MNAATACAPCREMRENSPHLLHSFGHARCRQALRDERRTNRLYVIRINPQGCVEGSMHAGPNTNVEEARRKFTPRAKERRAEAAEGWRHELVNGTDWAQRARPCLTGECDHAATP